MLWGMGAGLFVFVALYHFARSLRSGAVSIIAPVFRLSFTPYKMLQQAVDELGTGKILGVVLNGDEKKSDKYYSRYYGSYYKSSSIDR